ncbi:MAG: hypothetical protein WDN24_00380 [Sphingomonas sp.]
MIRRRILFSAAAAASVALSGCGGSSPTPTPSPTATVTPTPSPSASPSYAALPLTAAAEFFTISAATSFTGDLAAGPVVLGGASTEARSDRVRLAVGNDTAANTFVIREAFEESRYVAANLTTAPDPGVREFVYRLNDASTPPVAGKYAQGEFLNNIIPSKVTTDAALALTRVSYASWFRVDGAAGPTRMTYTIYGYPTAIGDVPTTGTVGYTAKIAGRVVQVGAGGTGALARLGGTVTLTANFATGLVNIAVNVTTIGAGGRKRPTAASPAPARSPRARRSSTAASAAPARFRARSRAASSVRRASRSA